MTTPIPELAPFVDQKTVVLTSFRQNGVGVPTAVNIAVDGDRAFAKTFAASGKYKRIRRNPRVTVAPSDFRGRPTGPAIPMTVRFVEGADFDLARRLIEGKHPFFQGGFVRLAHKLRGDTTVFMELRPALEV
jgi:PPOX class probable F420-dependent enzyme